MKRTFTFLMSLFLVVGSMWAQVTSLEGFSQDKCYAFETNGRGAWAVDAEGTSLSSTTKLGIAVDVNDPKQQFAVLSANNGADFYLYSVGAKKLVKADGSLVAGPADAVAIADAGSGRVQFRFRDLEGKYINVDGQGSVAINGWSTIDAGNSVSVTEAGDINAAEAWAQLLKDCKAQAQELVEANAENHAVAPALSQYTTDGYNAFVEAVNNAATMEDVAAAITAFEMTKNLYLFTIDGGAKDYVVGKSVYDDNSGTLYFKETNTEDLSMLWMFDMTETEVGVTDKVVVRNAATGNLFWGADFIKVTETSENDGAGIADDGIFLFYTNGTGDPVHAQGNGSQVVRWGSKEADSGSAWKFTFVGISNPAAYDLSEVAANFKEKAVAFAGLQENAALSALGAVQEKWAETMGVVEPLFGAVEEGALVLKADVEAAIEQMDAITAVVDFYSGEAFTAALAKAGAAMDELDEESDAYAALFAAKNVSTVTTVAQLEAKITEIDEIIAALEPEADPNDYTSYITEWTTSWSYNDEKLYRSSDETFDFYQTITLPAGQYKMTAQAAYRYAGSNDQPTAEEFEYNKIQAGGEETHLAKLYAQTARYKYEANVQNRWEGASDVNYAPEGETVNTVNGKFVPNSTIAVVAWFKAGKYLNELVFNVQEECEVRIGIAKPETDEVGQYTNIGAWTLTRLGDAEADPQPEEPEEPEYTEEDYDLDAPAYTDVTAQYIKNAAMSANIDGWKSVGGGTTYEAAVYEFYAGWGALENTSGSLTQAVTLPAGTYRLTGKAFYRAGAAYHTKPGVSLGYLVAGNNKVLVKTLGSIEGLGAYADNRSQASKAFYTDGLYDNVLDFVLEEETTLNIGYECTHEDVKSWFIVGAVKLESVQPVPGALVPLFEAQAQEFCAYSSMTMSSLPAVQAKWETLCAEVMEIYEAINNEEKVLDKVVRGAMDEMTAMTAELAAIEKAYATFNAAKFAIYDIQDNSTPNNDDVKAAFDAAVEKACDVSTVTTPAELEAKVAEMEAARQAYVVNALPAEGSTFDYTFLLANPSFETGNLDGWTVRRKSAETDVRTDATQGTDGRYVFNSWWNGVYLTQDAVGIPNGQYRLTVAFVGGDPGNDATAYIIANADTLGVNLKNGNPYTDFSVETNVINNKLHIATVGGNDDDTAEEPVGSFNQDGYWWYKADNFRLEFIGELPDEVLLTLKKEAFLARYSQFEALTETLDYSWNAINTNYYYSVQEEAYGVANTIDEVTEMAVLDELMEAMDEAEEMLAKAYAAGANHNVVANAFMDAMGFATVVNEEACAEAYAVYESKSGMMFGYSVSTVEDLEAATAELLAAYFQFVSNATPAEGTLFDVTFLVQNPNFEKDVEGWTTVKAGWNGGDGFGGVAGIAEIAEWGATSWNASMSQTLTGLPNGTYVVKAVWMAAIGIEMTFAANEGETTVVGIGDNGGNVDKDGNVVEMGQGFRGWQYVEAEGSVEDGELTIAVSSSSTAQYTWSNADAFKLYYSGYVAKDPTGIENIDAEVETVIFDLSGRRVQKMEKGIYIVNGKKVIVK